MDHNLTYYIGLLLAIIVGVILFKKIASCLIRTIITVILLALLAVAYYMMQEGA